MAYNPFELPSTFTAIYSSIHISPYVENPIHLLRLLLYLRGLGAQRILIGDLYNF